MKKARLAALVLALALAMSTISTFAYPSNALLPKQQTYDKPFADVKGTWCESYVQTVYEAGLMQGKTAAAFDSRSQLTNGQIVVISARLHKLLTGGGDTWAAGEKWYSAYYDYFASVSFGGAFTAADLMVELYPPEEPCPRYAFVWALSDVLYSADVTLPTLNQVAVLPDSTDPSILNFYEAGIVNGKDKYGTFDEYGTLTRGEAAAMLARVIDPAQRLTFTVTPFDLSRDVLGVKGDTVLVTVKDLRYTADQLAYGVVNNLIAAKLNDGFLPSLSSLAEGYACYEASLELLARQKSVSLSAAELNSAKEDGRLMAGYMGVSQAGWTQENQNYMLLTALSDYYYAHYASSEDKSSFDRLNDDLFTLESSLTAQSTDALKALDAETVYQRAADSPLRYLYSYLFVDEQ
ncbi:S-layer homology domain-containing protein [Oscillibacter hominis]|uniref:S-layer homology domain-containing protein n=1 Tax=Oscillibacter hominis TaxID=2763056 RepID=A0A7G9B3R2_9FIRM|nr:S-layer homology domain-containing protein [Oscillibacter hominis]QNL44193.1 S-layer homology domain-containing protein [Oscillibacter hominis]